MIDLIKDLKKFFHFKKKEGSYDYIFFNENEYTFQYLKKIIEKKNKKKKIIIIIFRDN